MEKMKLRQRNNLLGCDPEFFFKTKKEGKIVGSEKVIPGRGLITSGSGKVIIDGVQAELNPRENTCREILKSEISNCFREVAKQLKIRKDIVADFSGVVEVEKEELKSLSEKSRVFGCAPDINIYSKSVNEVKVNPAIYRKRCGGGHIHLGVYSGDLIVNGLFISNRLINKYPTRYNGTIKGLNLHELKQGMEFTLKQQKHFGIHAGKLELKGTALALQQPERVIPMLDILLGNTCVLLDNNKEAVERRRVYGKAGDFRYTCYGLEYRTLSNFWLRSYPIMSFVFGMARTALEVVSDAIDCGNDMEEKILKTIKFSRIERAINKNNFKLAQENFNQIKDIIIERCSYTDHHPLTESTIKEFEYVVETGIDRWFKEDPIKHWTKENLGFGWEGFCDKIVKPKMKKSLLSKILKI